MQKLPAEIDEGCEACDKTAVYFDELTVSYLCATCAAELELEEENNGKLDSAF